MTPRAWQWWLWVLVGLSVVAAYVSLTGAGVLLGDGTMEAVPLWLLVYVAMALCVAFYPLVHMRLGRRASK